MVLLPFHGTVLALCPWPSSNPRFFHLTLSPWALCSTPTFTPSCLSTQDYIFTSWNWPEMRVEKLGCMRLLFSRTPQSFILLLSSVPMEGLQEPWGTFRISAGWPKGFFHAVFTFPCSVRRLGQQWGVPWAVSIQAGLWVVLLCTVTAHWSNSLRLR